VKVKTLLGVVIALTFCNIVFADSSALDKSRELRRQMKEVLETRAGPAFVSGLPAGEAHYPDISSGTPKVDNKRLLKKDVSVKLNFITDIVFPEGERLENIRLGDEDRFSYTTFLDKKGAGSWHIYLETIQSDSATNMFVVTDGADYEFSLSVGELADTIVRLERGADPPKNSYMPENIEVSSVEELYFDYCFKSGKKYSWKPRTVFDDNRNNTYLVFSEGVLGKKQPVVVGSGKHGTEVTACVNNRNLMIIPGVYNKLDISCGNERLVLKRKDARWK